MDTQVGPNPELLLAAFRQFPEPLLVIDGDGHAQFANHRFGELFDLQRVDALSLGPLLGDANGRWHTVHWFSPRGDRVEARARGTRIGMHHLVVVDGAAHPDAAPEFAELHARILELERLGSIDHLTGAWNRAHLDRVIEVESNRSIQYRQPVSLVLLDIDHFKEVNDRHGHLVGDAVLKELTHVVRGRVRAGDIVFRWGGEEFVVLLAAAGYAQAGALAEKLRAAVERHPFPGAGHLTVSLGVAERLAIERTETWFRRLDAALYEAKRGGRNRVVVDRRGNSDEWAPERLAGALELKWQDGYRCGDPVIDDEHRQLFALANALIAAALRPDRDEAAYHAALEHLLEHIAQHFAHEEAILARHGYDKLERHRRAHEALLQRARKLQFASAASGATLGEVVEFLANDLVVRHFWEADRDFFPLFAATSAPAGAPGGS